jgi:hypothetical protein
MNNDYNTIGLFENRNLPPGDALSDEKPDEAGEVIYADMLDDESAAILIRFFDRYDEHFRELLRFLSRKQEHVAADDLQWLEDSLQEEEKLVMRGNSLEQQRIELMTDCGVPDFTANELLAVFPEQQLGQLRRALESMDAAIYYIKETNNAILDLIEKKLEAQAQYIAKMSGDTLTPKAVSGTISTYGPDGEKIKKPTLAAEDIGKV